MTKHELRKTMLARRDALSPEAVREGSLRVRQRVLDLDATSAFIYVSIDNEVQTHDLIRELLRRGRRVSVPRIMDRGVMEAHRIESFDELAPGRLGILAPTVERPEPEPDLCVLPCVAVTEQGDRLGRGGGYYDRYLAVHPDARTIAIAFDEQVIDAIPVVAHDRRVHAVITPTRVIQC